MATYRLSPQERASVIARKVDRLFVRNRDYFLSHAETFRREEAERKKRAREKDAEQSRAVEDWRPGPDPAPAVMVTLLAALHDECLPDSPPILDPASSKPLSVAQAQDPGLWALFGARLWCVCAKQGATDRLDALETYLSRARADIEAAEVVKEAGAERARQEREQKTGATKPPVQAPTGNWSRPMALTDLSVRIFGNPRQVRKLKSVYKSSLRKIGKKTWEICLDGFAENLRREIQKP